MFLFCLQICLTKTRLLLIVCVKRHLLIIIHSFFIRISFIRISRLKFAEYFKNKAEAEILKGIDIILCVETSVNTIQFYV